MTAVPRQEGYILLAGHTKVEIAAEDLLTKMNWRRSTWLGAWELETLTAVAYNSSEQVCELRREHILVG